MYYPVAQSEDFLKKSVDQCGCRFHEVVIKQISDSI